MQKRNNYPLLFAVFLAISLITLTLSVLGFLNPVNSIFQSLFAPLQSFTFSAFSGFTNTSSNSEISLLKKQNQELSEKLIDQTKLQHDNEALKDQFQNQYPKSSDLLEANVIGAPTFIPQVSYPKEYVLDKGKNDGVKIGHAVVINDNLVGSISYVSGSISTVKLVTNPQTSFTAKTLETDALGVVKGQGESDLVLENVLLSDSLKKGDMVITKGDISSQGIGLPPNLIVGRIKSVSKIPSDLFQKAEIQSLLDFKKTNKVFIFTNI